MESALLDTTWQMWVVCAIILVGMITYATEKLSIEVTSLSIIASLTLIFTFFPLLDDKGNELLTLTQLFAGFANTALVTVIAFLIIGQGVYRSGALDGPVRRLLTWGKNYSTLSLLLLFAFIIVVSAFLNNTPVVVMFIPILAGLARESNMSTHKIMMPLSFLCILSGMTTLIGSSTNIMASGVAQQLGLNPIGFFDFALPGIILAGVGILYTALIVPRVLQEKKDEVPENDGMGKQYIVQITIPHNHTLLGEKAVAGLFPSLKNVTVRLLRRNGKNILPPYEDLELEAGDVLTVAVTRQVLTDELIKSKKTFGDLLILSAQNEGRLNHGNAPFSAGEKTGNKASNLMLMEAIVAYGSRLSGRHFSFSAFSYDTADCLVLGLQRRSRMQRSSLNDIRLEEGDILIFLCFEEALPSLRNEKDILPLEWMATELPNLVYARRAALIAMSSVLLAATEILPVPLAAFLGATTMLAARVLNIQQALRAIDQRIFLLIGAALAMATALDATGGSNFMAATVVNMAAGAEPTVVLSALFLATAFATNIISNNATVVLFTPIAINIAQQMGLNPLPFIYGIIFASNCSFATPIAYQTNILVMEPGNYTFKNFLTAGIPLIILLWLTYSFMMPWLYDLKPVT